MSNKSGKEGMNAARLFMVLSSVSPLFILWAIHGSRYVPEIEFSIFCGVMVVLPNLFLWYRVRTTQRLNEKRELVVGIADDNRDHILVYLFAMLLPFYSSTFETLREFVALLAAIGFIVYLFWHLNLHYMNIFFAALNYHVFTVRPLCGDNPISGKSSFVVITKRSVLCSGEMIFGYRLSNTVYLEV